MPLSWCVEAVSSCSTKVVHYIGNVETLDQYQPGAPKYFKKLLTLATKDAIITTC